MANLSNINGKFVVEQTTGFVGIGTTDPSFLIEAAGTNAELALNASSIYRLRSTSSDEFLITKNGVGDRLTIASGGNATFSAKVFSTSTVSGDTGTTLVTKDYVDSGDGSSINTILITVAAVGGGNRYFLDGVQQANAVLQPGFTYRFDQSNATNNGHPLRFSSDSANSSPYTTGVTAVGTPGSSGAYTQIITTQATPVTLYYYCTIHSGMGGAATIRIIKTDSNAIFPGELEMPSYIRHTGDTNTYIGFSANDTIDLTTASNVVLRIDSSANSTFAGNVNIRTGTGTQPSYFSSFLNVQNNASTSDHASITITSGSGGFAGLHFGDSDNGRIGQIAYNNSNNSLLLTSNNSTRMTIDSSGNVIIGNTAVDNPNSLSKVLEIENGGSVGVILNDSRDTPMGLENRGAVFHLTHNTNSRLVVDGASGNVGIGATNIEGRLDVRMNFLSQNWIPDGTSAKWGEVWNTAGTPGTYFDDVMLHVDTNRAGPATGGVVGIAFSPGWQGHQNWGIYSFNTSGSGNTQGDLAFVNQLNTGTIQERMRIKSDGNIDIITPITNAFFGLSLKYSTVEVAVFKVNNATGQIDFGGNAAGYFPTFASAGIERMRINTSGDVGIGTTPETAGPTWRTLFIGASATIVSRQAAASYDSIFANNYYVNSSNQDRVRTTGPSSRMFLDGNNIRFQISPSTSVGGSPTWSEIMRVDDSGKVGIGGGTIEGKLSIDYTAAELPTSGTTSNSAIQVTSSLNNQLNLGLNTVSGSYGAYIQASDNNLAVPYPLNLQPNGGAVAIGTSNNAATLNIGGRINATTDTLATPMTIPRNLFISYGGASYAYTFDPVALFGANKSGGTLGLRVSGWPTRLFEGIIIWRNDGGGSSKIGTGVVTLVTIATNDFSGVGVSVSLPSSNTNEIRIDFSGWHSNDHGWSCYLKTEY